MSGSSSNFFDFNHDGKLDALEMSAKMEFWDEISKDHSSEYGSSYVRGRRINTGSGGAAQRAAGDGGAAQRAAGNGGAAQGKSGAPAGQGGNPQSGSQKVSDEADPRARLIVLVLLVIACVYAVFRFGQRIKISYDREAALVSVEKRMEEYKERIAEELPGLCEARGIGLDGTYTAEAAPQLEYSPGSGEKYQFYDVKPDYSVTLHADESFDGYDDRTKYEYLVKLYPMAGEAHDAFLQECFPEYAALRSQEPAEGLTIGYRKPEYEVYIETPRHLYQYSKMYDDLFMLDGESCFLEDEQSRWTK